MEREPATRDWGRIQNRLTIALLALAVLLAFFAVVEVLLSLAARFKTTILMFIIGAVVAYLLIPAVNAAQRVVRKRWAAIVVVYLLVFAVVVLVGTLLFSPFVEQARSLAANLDRPSPASLQGVVAVRNAASQVASDMALQQGLVDSGLPVAATDVQKVQTEIAALRANIDSLQQSSAAQSTTSSATRGGASQAPTARTRIPPSYVAPIRSQSITLSSLYARATASSGAVDKAALHQAVIAAGAVRSAAVTAYTNVSSTSLLLLDLQAWLDDHSIKADIHQGFGEVTHQLSSQTALIVNNSIGIVLAAGTLFVNGILVLIISIYFLSDGPRLVRSFQSMGPPSFREHFPFYVASLDASLSGYIRGQILLAGAAGILGAAGALMLSVPYAVLIGLSTFFLCLVPVIGPIILVIPPVIIALVFTPLSTALILTVYFLVMMQLITNVIGPRVMGSAVGIHPLEAMAAAFIGFPLAGVLGAFFAVPIVGFLHVAFRHAYQEFIKTENATRAAQLAAAPTAQLARPEHGRDSPLPPLGERDAPA